MVGLTGTWSCPSDRDVHLLFHRALASPGCVGPPLTAQKRLAALVLSQAVMTVALHLLLLKWCSPGMGCHLAAEGALAGSHVVPAQRLWPLAPFTCLIVYELAAPCVPWHSVLFKIQRQQKILLTWVAFDIVWPFLLLLKAFLLDASAFFFFPPLLLPLKLFFQLSVDNFCRL